MRISFQCPACGVTGKAPEALAGQFIDCPKCKQPFPLPPAENTASPPARLAASVDSTVKFTAARSPYFRPVILLGGSLILALVSAGLMKIWGAGDWAGLLVLVGALGFVGSVIWIARLGDLDEDRPLAPQRSAAAQAAAAAARVKFEETTEKDLLASIDDRLKGIAVDIYHTRYNTGCLLWALIVGVVVILIALATLEIRVRV